jgi:hypothetical protein
VSTARAARMASGGAPRLLDTLSVAPTGAYSLRKCRKNYGGAAISLRRASDSAVTDIGFDGSGNLDTAAIGAFCAGSVGTIATWYDQSGHGSNMAPFATTHEYRIYSGSATDTKGGNSKPAALMTDNSRGYAVGISTQSGTVYSGVLVGSFTNTVTSSAPRYLSVGSGSSADSNSSTRALLIYRLGSATPAATWASLRNSVQMSTAAGAYDTQAQVMSVFDGTNHTMYVNNSAGTPVSTASSFRFSVLLMSEAQGNTTWQSVTNGTISEAFFFSAALGSTDRSTLHTDQAAYYGTP